MEQLTLQDEAARRLRKLRHEHGALDLETIEARPVTKDGKIVDLEVTHKNRARELVEDLMIAANGATARFLEAARVLVDPARGPCSRSAGIASSSSPRASTSRSRHEPDAQALVDVPHRSAAPPIRSGSPISRCPWSSCSVRASTHLQRAADPDDGHFGLAVEDYAHSTAPNRRYPDLVTQRLLLSVRPRRDAAVHRRRAARDRDPLHRARERRAQGRAHDAQDRGGRAARAADRRDRSTVIVTGATPKGVFVRVFRPAAEGRVVRGEHGLDVGDTVRVKLVDTEPMKGFIDFVRI